MKVENFIGLRLVMQVLHSSEKSEHLPLGMVAATALWLRGHLRWHDLLTKFHKNLPVCSEVDRGDSQTQTHRQDGDFISLHFSFRKESKLKASQWTVAL
jgi:hypothetical protein